MTAALEPWPLTWPIGWTRRRHAARAKFGRKGMGESRSVANDRLRDELRQLGAERVLVSSNIPCRRDGSADFSSCEPDDHGVAVYFQIKGEPRVLACDKWDRVSDNMVAISKHVEAIRGQLRWGVGSVEQAFGGYKALPAVGARADWHVVLGVAPGASWETITERRRQLLEQHHPDRVGGDAGRAAEVNEAFQEARAARGR